MAVKKRQGVKSAKKTIDISERRWLVLELKKQGGTFRDIAAQLVSLYGATGDHGVTPKYDHTLAYKDFQAAIAELNKRNSDSAEEHRALDLERLDGLMAAFYDKATDGDMFAFDKVMKVIESRAAWFGYNAPTKLDHTSSDGSMRPTAYQFVPYVEPDTDTDNS